MSNSEFSPADYAAMTNNNGFGGSYGDGLWLIVLLLLFGGWGGNGYGNNGGQGSPFVMADAQRGFDQAAIMGGLNGITQGLANAEVSRCNSQTNILQALNNNQAGIMTQLFAMQQAQQQCCCDNRMGVADLKATVLTENCADRYEAANNTRDIIGSQQAGTQAIIDKLCQLELDGYKRENDQLRADNTALRFDRSQAEQTAAILANNEAQTANLIKNLNPAPIPAYPVANPNCCTNQQWSSCGCNGSF